MENISVADVFRVRGSRRQVGGIVFDCHHHAGTVICYKKGIWFEPKSCVDPAVHLTLAARRPVL